MDLRQLRYFIGIVQAGGLSRAASQLNVAQSAISHHLASLESELGKPLVTRGPKGIVLTEAGAVLYRHAEAILRHVDFAKQDAMSALSVPSGHVAVGFPTAHSALLEFELFERVRRGYPQIQLHLVGGRSSLVRELLNNGRLDIAILFAGESERGLTVEPLFWEELFFITAAGGETGPISLAEAAKQPFVVPGPNSGIQRAAAAEFKKQNLTMRVVGEIDTIGTVRQVVMSGNCNAIMPWSALYDRGQKFPLVYRRFSDITFGRPVALCSSELVQHSPAFEAVASTLKALIRDLIDGGRWEGVSPLKSTQEPSLLALAP